MFRHATVLHTNSLDSIIFKNNNDKIHRYGFRLKHLPQSKIKHLDIVHIYKMQATYRDTAVKVKYKVLTIQKEHSFESKGHNKSASTAGCTMALADYFTSP